MLNLVFSWFENVLYFYISYTFRNIHNMAWLGNPCFSTPWHSSSWGWRTNTIKLRELMYCRNRDGKNSVCFHLFLGWFPKQTLVYRLHPELPPLCHLGLWPRWMLEVGWQPGPHWQLTKGTVSISRDWCLFIIYFELWPSSCFQNLMLISELKLEVSLVKINLS